MLSSTKYRLLLTTILQNTIKKPTVTTRGISRVLYKHQQPIFLTPNTHDWNFIRTKSKASKKKQQNAKESDAEESDNDHPAPDFDNLIVDKHTKVMLITVNSLRVDGVLKNCLGIARNKIEEMFYESKIRVNGKKLLKKSDPVNEGDEIDVIKGVSLKNPNFLQVARVEVLDIKNKNEGYGVRVRRSKNLTVENYEDAWKGADTSS